MSFLNNLAEFATLLLSLLTAPFTTGVLGLSIPVYPLLARHEKRRRLEAKRTSRNRREQAAIKAEDRKRRLARVPTLPPLRKRHGRSDHTGDRWGA